MAQEKHRFSQKPWYQQVFKKYATIRTKGASENKGWNSTFPDNHPKLGGTKVITSIFPTSESYISPPFLKSWRGLKSRCVGDHRSQVSAKERTIISISEPGFGANTRHLPPGTAGAVVELHMEPSSPAQQSSISPSPPAPAFLPFSPVTHPSWNRKEFLASSRQHGNRDNLANSIQTCGSSTTFSFVYVVVFLVAV